jgi:hypothetical protein
MRGVWTKPGLGGVSKTAREISKRVPVQRIARLDGQWTADGGRGQRARGRARQRARALEQGDRGLFALRDEGAGRAGPDRTEGSAHEHHQGDGEDRDARGSELWFHAPL